MTIKEMHYDFKIKADKVDTLSKQDFRPHEIDWLLNEAHLGFVKSRMSGFNVMRTPFEGSQKRIQDLASIHIKYPSQPAIPLFQHDDNTYELALANLEFPVYLMTRLTVDVSDGNCTSRANVKIVEVDDLFHAQKDPFQTNLDEIPANYGKTSIANNNTSLYLYPGNLTLTDIYPEYVKVPKRVNLGGYVYIDGNTYNPIDSELPEHTHNELVNIAVDLAKILTEDPSHPLFNSYKNIQE